MRSYKWLGVGLALAVSGCANNAALDLKDTPIPTPSPESDAGMTGGQPGGETSGVSGGASGDAEAGDPDDTTGANTAGGGNSGSAGTADGGTVIPSPPQGLLISEVMARPSSGSDNEWIEIWNGSKSSFDLNGCALATGRDASDETVIDVALLLAPGAYVLLGRDGVEAESGVKPDYVYAGIYLSPEETITLSCNAQIVSQVSYTAAEVGASLQLDARYAAAGKSDVPAAWCLGRDPLKVGSNLGTPKAKNRDCSGVPAP